MRSRWALLPALELGEHRLSVEAAAAGVSAAVSDVTRDECRAIQTTVGRQTHDQTVVST
jgi:hypothetical protein